MSVGILRTILSGTAQRFCTVQHLSQSSTKFSTEMANKSALLLLANGAEEMEAVITIDVLRRAGIAVTVASITNEDLIKCGHDVQIKADAKLADATKNRTYDAVILPGGLGGSQALSESKEVGKLLKDQEAANRVIAAICAAPTALQEHGIAKGKQVTLYPSMKDKLSKDYTYVDAKVVTDGNLITSKGPATAYAFGLAIVEKLLKKEDASRVAKGLLYEGYN